MKLGNRASISLHIRQNGVENREKVYGRRLFGLAMLQTGLLIRSNGIWWIIILIKCQQHTERVVGQ